MFRGLRLQLTLLFALAALGLVLLISGGVYLIMSRYFQGVTDLALEYRMAYEFSALGATLPSDLEHADREWRTVRREIDLLRGLGSNDAEEIGGYSSGEAEPIEADEQEPESDSSGPGPDDSSDNEHLSDSSGPGSGSDDASDSEDRSDSSGPGSGSDDASDSEDRSDSSGPGSGRGDRSDDEDENSEAGVTTGAIPPTATSPPPTAPATVTATPMATVLAAIPPADPAAGAELAAIFAMPLDASGQPVPVQGSNPPIPADQAAFRAAISNGRDVRTITATSGEHIRLLTYRVTGDGGPAALQLGRPLDDQNHVLQQLTVGLVLLGALSILLLSISSWWLAGRALRPAAAAWEGQQNFISSASHELRTPLTLIRASAEMALRTITPQDSDQRDLLSDVVVESDHMRRLVDDLLTLSHLDSGRLSLELAPVAVAPLLDDLHRQVGRLGQARGITVTQQPLEATVLADADRLRQILLILLDNALRHTAADGTVVLGAARQGRAIIFSVRDSGEGIAPEHLPHLFDRFYRADSARGRTNGTNAGLGLSIAQGLVRAMGGQIGAESQVGRGTTIWFSVPGA